MRKKQCVIVQIFVFSFLLLLTTSSGCIYDLPPRSFSSSYIYNIQIQSNGTLENATFIIPVPIKNGVPNAGNRVLRDNDFFRSTNEVNSAYTGHQIYPKDESLQPGMSVALIKAPQGLNLTGVVSFQHDEPWYLLIHAENPVPMNRSGEIYTLRKDILDQNIQIANYRITPNPINSEAIILPKFNFSWKDPQVAEIRGSNIVYKPFRIPQQTLVFVDYNATQSTRVTVYFAYYGHNSWKQGYDAWYSNSFKDSFSGILDGEKHGWYPVSGYIESTTVGFYPNLDYPEWKKALNQTAEP